MSPSRGLFFSVGGGYGLGLASLFGKFGLGSAGTYFELMTASTPDVVLVGRAFPAGRIVWFIGEVRARRASKCHRKFVAMVGLGGVGSIDLADAH